MLRSLSHIILAIVLLSLNSIDSLSQKSAGFGDERVLLISSYNPETMSVMNTINDFVAYCDENGGMGSMMVENMNTKSLSESHLWKNRMHTILKKYDNDELRPSIIILLGQEAWAAYLSQNLSFIEKNVNVPVMVCMASRNVVRMPSDTTEISTWMPTSIDYTYYKSKYNIVGGVLYEYDIEKNIEMISQLYPKTKNIALLTDNSYGGLTMMALANDQLKKHREYHLIRLDGRQSTIYSMSEALANLPENTTMMLGTWRVDKTESFYVKNSLHTLMDANMDLPVTSLTRTGIDYWAVGGYIPQYRSQGREMAEKVLAYLKSQKQGDKLSHDALMTIIGSKYVFNNEKIYAVAEASGYKVPEDAEILNVKPSFYEEYKVVIHVVLMAFCILVLILIIVLWFLAKTRMLTNALKASQKDLIEARDKAEESNRMKTAFLANMSHEIRTPLNAIVGFSEVMTTDDTLSTEERTQINGIISKNSELLLGLINDILDMARLESGRTKYITAPCDVVEMCRDTMSTCQIAARRNDISYRLDTDMEKCIAVVDNQHIRQVLINLLSNSNKFTKSGSITLSLHLVGDKLNFAVTDTGIGIPKNKRDKVFERFEKLSEMSQGFGIGLSLCKNIVEHFGGRIWVDPEYSAGAKFMFYIPFVSPENDLGEESQAL